MGVNVAQFGKKSTDHFELRCKFPISILVGFVTYIWFQNSLISILISCALIINLISSVFAGVIVPLVLRKLNQDPAIAGSVVVTTVTDVIGFLSFLGLATIFLI